MGGKQNETAGVAVCAQLIFERDGARWIEPVERLIEDEVVRAGEEGRCEHEFLLHAQRTVTDEGGKRSMQREGVAEGVKGGGQRLLIESADELEIFAAGECGKHLRIVGNKEKMATRRERAAVQAVDENAAAIDRLWLSDAFKSVVLPMPFRPTRAMMWPSCSVSESCEKSGVSP